MHSNARLTLCIRLEDAAALAFFFGYLVLAVFFQELRQEATSPVNVLIIVSAVSPLLLKELIHYFVAGREVRTESNEGLGEFVRPFWVIIRDWLPFFMLLFMYYTLSGNVTHMMVTHDRDAQLIAWDQR